MNLSPSYQEGARCHTDTLHCQWLGEISLSVQICPELLKSVPNSLRYVQTSHRVYQDSALLKSSGLYPHIAVCYFEVFAVFTSGSSCWSKWELQSASYTPDSLQAPMESVNAFWAQTQQNWVLRAVLLKSLVLYRAGIPGGFCLFSSPFCSFSWFGGNSFF